uniref:1-phosphatidylinositol 4-kinase n=1 Tax=Globisporangium ultimum (strain ATCC 200006 / CBS 805.95 / DAOM BR144) TaxID=431595 RepID=K3WC43_GLOUD
MATALHSSRAPGRDETALLRLKKEPLGAADSGVEYIGSEAAQQAQDESEAKTPPMTTTGEKLLPLAPEARYRTASTTLEAGSTGDSSQKKQQTMELEMALATAAATFGEHGDKGAYFEGYLRKRYSTSMYMGSWRYCILQGNRLRWYMTQELAHADSQLRGEVWVRDVEPWNGQGSMNTYPHAFALRTASHRLLLCSSKSVDEKDEWLANLQKCIQHIKRHDGGDRPHTHIHHEGGSENRRIVPEDMLRATNAESVGGVSFAESIPRSPAMPVLGAAVPAPTDTTSATSESECTRCAIRFGAVLARRYVCGSCAKPFCSRHCSSYVKLHHLGLRSARRCCMACARRQDFILYLSSLSRFLNSTNTGFPNMDAVILQCGPQFDTSDLFERTIEKLRRGPMSLVKTIKILYQTRKKPHLFVVACERLPFYVENCIDRVENLWYQILHLFQCCDADPESSAIQLFYLRRYIRAICRRSPRIALQTIWHVQASVGDASGLHPHSLLSLLGFVYPMSEGNLSLWREHLLAQYPDHQRDEILSGLKLAYSQSEALIERENGSLIERWLNATTVPDFEASATELASSGIELCEFQTSILYESLSVDDWARGPTQIEALVFDQVNFVQSLADISERLRHVQPVQKRGMYLEIELKQMNDKLLQSALYPLCTASDQLYRVLRIPPNEGKVFTTKMRAPTLLFLETVPVNATTLVGSNDRFRPFVSTSHPRNSTFFETLPPSFAILGDGSSRDSLVSSTESSNDAFATPKMHKGRGGSQQNYLEDMDSMSDDATNGKSNTASALGGIIGRHMTFPGADYNRDRGDSTNASEARGFSLVSTNSHKRHNVDNIVYDSKVYGESWEERKERIRVESPYGHLPGWTLFSIIVKTNDDLRQEVFTMQLIKKFQSIFEYEGTNLWLRTYRIVATGASIGLLETINDACSLDHLKKNFPGGNLFAYFKSVYGEPSTPSFEAARKNFIDSMAAYSVVSYLLLVKDRHNGNILLSTEGHIIHIDFGFILGIAPGGRFSIEDAPFKLTVEMVEIMGGMNSPGFERYHQSMCDGFLALQKYQSEIAALLQTTGQHSPFPCFESAKLAKVITDMRDRLCVGLNRQQVRRRVDHLIRKSYNVWGTRQYDAFQLRSNNIHP